MKLKRLPFYLVLFAFCGLTVWWVFYFPYNADRLYRCIPYDAAVITEHSTPAARLVELGANPVVRQILVDAGASTGAMERVLSDKRTATLVGHLAGRKTLFGYTEHLGPSYRPARIVATWIGWRTHPVKLAFLLGRIPDFERLDFPSPTPIWVRPLRDGHRPPLMSVAVFEGVLVALVSEDPLAMAELVGRIYSGQGSLPRLMTHLDRETDSKEDTAADRIWLSWPPRSGRRRVRLVMTAGLETVSSSGISGWARFVYTPPAAAPHPAEDTLALMRRTLGTRAPAEIACPLAYLQPILADPQATWTERFAFETLTKVMTRDQSVGLSLLTGEYGGRILVLNIEEVERSLSVAVPTLMLCLPIDESVDATELLRATLDKMNSELKLALIPHALPDTPFSMYVIDDASDNAYSRMPKEQKVALAVVGDRMLLSSNLKVLSELLLEHSGRDAPTSDRTPDRQATPAYVHIDLDAACPDIARLLTFYQMVASARNRRTAATVTEWVKSLRAFGDAELHLHSADDQLQVRFRLGQAK